MREAKEAGEEAAEGGAGGSGRQEMLAVGTGDAEVDKTPPRPRLPAPAPISLSTSSKAALLVVIIEGGRGEEASKNITGEWPSPPLPPLNSPPAITVNATATSSLPSLALSFIADLVEVTKGGGGGRGGN